MVLEGSRGRDLSVDILCKSILLHMHSFLSYYLYTLCIFLRDLGPSFEVPLLRRFALLSMMSFLLFVITVGHIIIIYLLRLPGLRPNPGS